MSDIWERIKRQLTSIRTELAQWELYCDRTLAFSNTLVASISQPTVSEVLLSTVSKLDSTKFDLATTARTLTEKLSNAAFVISTRHEVFSSLQFQITSRYVELWKNGPKFLLKPSGLAVVSLCPDPNRLDPSVALPDEVQVDMAFSLVSPAGQESKFSVRLFASLSLPKQLIVKGRRPVVGDLSSLISLLPEAVRRSMNMDSLLTKVRALILNSVNGEMRPRRLPIPSLPSQGVRLVGHTLSPSLAIALRLDKVGFERYSSNTLIASPWNALLRLSLKPIFAMISRQVGEQGAEIESGPTVSVAKNMIEFKSRAEEHDEGNLGPFSVYKLTVSIVSDFECLFSFSGSDLNFSVKEVHRGQPDVDLRPGWAESVLGDTIEGLAALLSALQGRISETVNIGNFKHSAQEIKLTADELLTRLVHQI